MRQSPLTRLLVALALAVPPHLVFAQSPDEPIASPRVTIERFVVEGNTLLDPQEIERALAPFAGTDKDFARHPARSRGAGAALPRRGAGAWFR